MCICIQVNLACKKGVSRPTEQHITTYTLSLNHLLQLPRYMLDSLHRSTNVSWTRPSFDAEKEKIKSFLFQHVAESWEDAVARRLYSPFIRRHMAQCLDPSYKMNVKYTQMLSRVWDKLSHITDLHFEDALCGEEDEEEESPAIPDNNHNIQDYARQNGCMDFVVAVEGLL
jgi:hypothetical protein